MTTKTSQQPEDCPLCGEFHVQGQPHPRGGGGDSHAIVEQTRAAIAQAKGETA